MKYNGITVKLYADCGYVEINGAVTRVAKRQAETALRVLAVARRKAYDVETTRLQVEFAMQVC